MIEVYDKKTDNVIEKDGYKILPMNKASSNIINDMNNASKIYKRHLNEVYISFAKDDELINYYYSYDNLIKFRRILLSIITEYRSQISAIILLDIGTVSLLLKDILLSIGFKEMEISGRNIFIFKNELTSFIEH